MKKPSSTIDLHVCGHISQQYFRVYGSLWKRKLQNFADLYFGETITGFREIRSSRTARFPTTAKLQRISGAYSSTLSVEISLFVIKDLRR